MAGRDEDTPPDAWKALLDPWTSARALGDVQAQALRAAGDLVERLTHAVDGPRTESDGEQAPAGEAEQAPHDSDAARLVDVWVEMLGGIARAFDGSTRNGADAGDRVDVDLAGDPGVARLRLVTTPSQPQASGEVWLHNHAGAPLADLALRTGGFVSSTGDELAAELEFDPGGIQEMPARSSRGVTATVTIAPDAPAGAYRGVVQIDGAPDAWIAVEVVVGSSEAEQ